VEKLTLKIEGMRCEGCEKTVESVLGKITGVTTVKADHTVKTATLEYNDEAPSHDLLNTLISRVGFQLID